MSLVPTENVKDFFEALDREIDSRLKGQDRELLRGLSRAHFRDFPLDELKGILIGDVYGALFHWWNRLQENDPQVPLVEVFNPSVEENGWLSTNSIVTVLVRDMPFLVDSIRLELNRRSINIHTIHSSVVTVARDKEHRLIDLIPRSEEPPDSQREAIIHLEISRHSSADEREDIVEGLRDVLDDVACVVADFHSMRERMRSAVQELEAHCPKKCDDDDINESRDFIHWLLDNHFTFLGVSEYRVADDAEGNRSLIEDPEARLGLMCKRDGPSVMFPFHEMKPAAERALLSSEALVFSKSSIRSRVHRAVYPDYVTVKRFDQSGQAIGEVRFVGLYTSGVYAVSPYRIPLVRKKVERVMASSGFRAEGHEAKDLQHVLDIFPRDELIQSDEDELRRTAMGIMRIQERRKVRLFVRRDIYGRFVSCLLFVPRDLFDSSVRKQVNEILADAFEAQESEYTVRLSESVLAQMHFTLRVDPATSPDCDLRSLEEKIIDVTRTWHHQFLDALIDGFGEEQGTSISREFEGAFPASYESQVDPRAAVNDIRTIHELSVDADIELNLYRPIGSRPGSLRLRLFQLETRLILSDVMPLLEHMGLRVMSEHPYEIEYNSGKTVWIYDFRLEFENAENLDIERVRKGFSEAFKQIWHGKSESDAFNHLILVANLNWRKVGILRSYARYMRQLNFQFSQTYIADTLSKHIEISQAIVGMFVARFDPALAGDEVAQSAAEAERVEEIVSALENVPSLDEDLIIRKYLSLIKGTVRTNYFQTNSEGEPHSYLSFKFTPMSIPEIPLPRPEYEIFVYSSRVEGVHLRGGGVARGGLRWSDRMQDYRTEVLGLMKAQQVKNAVIVPVGAKGGFVAKNLPANGTRDEIQQEGVACYQTFIQGLLEITDNRVDGEVVAPTNVVRKDGDDAYFVVAADKGTASFSDVANEISIAKKFWLGDAFASGGSVGYDHKKMGITARGAWVSVRQHFSERGVDIQEEDFSVVGIGDMSGDVFGNGMLLSKHIRLLAAFNHLSILIDPDPNPAESFNERQRMFDMPRSNWTDYNADLISKGGGVFSRNAKSIPISPEMKKCFAIEDDRLTPDGLIRRLLVAPVDLLWNGGIGTYVKSREQSHADVGDKTNDAVRVNGSELRCKVVGEGGNLGLTQLGRVEYALTGGAINTDFIDNVGGVDCSDHEVNIKILLNQTVLDGTITEKNRRTLLKSMTGSVTDLVLGNSFHQGQAISLAEQQALLRMGEYRRFIRALENSGTLDPKLEFIPDDEALVERFAQGKGLVRPELSVLMSYSKVFLKKELVKTDIAEDPYLSRAIETAFPGLLLDRFRDQVYAHRLKTEIIANELANDLVNHVGFTFVHRLMESTGTTVSEVVRAYVTTRDIFELSSVWKRIEQIDGNVGVDCKLKLMLRLMKLLRRSSRWCLRNHRCEFDAGDQVKQFQEPVGLILRTLPDVLKGVLKEDWEIGKAEMLESGIPEDLAHDLASLPHFHSCLGIVEAGRVTGASIERVTETFFAVGESLQLHWFVKLVSGMTVESYWQALARQSALEDLDWQQRAITVSVLESTAENETVQSGVERWMASYGTLITRWQAMLTELQGGGSSDFAVISVALRELLDLAQASAHHAHDEKRCD